MSRFEIPIEGELVDKLSESFSCEDDEWSWLDYRAQSSPVKPFDQGPEFTELALYETVARFDGLSIKISRVRRAARSSLRRREA
jgi:hypothetical protein